MRHGRLAPAPSHAPRRVAHPPPRSTRAVDAPTVSVATVERVADVDAATWDAIVRAQPEYNPFVSHAFLSALEGGLVGERGRK
jgi:Peptidogalycan biosysnthesis/recognition